MLRSSEHARMIRNKRYKLYTDATTRKKIFIPCCKIIFRNCVNVILTSLCCLPILPTPDVSYYTETFYTISASCPICLTHVGKKRTMRCSMSALLKLVHFYKLNQGTILIILKEQIWTQRFGAHI